MSDPFIDALHDRLTTASSPGAQREPHAPRAVALTRWWEEFVDVLGQKVGAWNERQAPRPPINFTKQVDGAVHVWHRSAEATLTRDGETVRVSTRLGTQPPSEVALAIKSGPEGHVVALVDGAELRTPSATAEHILTPILVETFANP